MDDGDLVRRVLQGDTAAFSALYRAHAPSVYTVVRSAAGAGDAADLVQDVFVRALERLSTLQSPELFRPWLFAIARNAATDSLRKRSRVDFVDDTDALAEVTDDGPGPDRVSELAELTALVRGAVADLQPRDAAAVAMVTQLGYSVAEVATVLGVSPGAAKVLLHRARRRLREALALEILVRQGAQGCPELQAMGHDDVLVAGRHIRSCLACLSAAGHEVQLYAWSPPSAPSPDTVMPASRSATPSDEARASGDQSTMEKPVTSGLAP